MSKTYYEDPLEVAKMFEDHGVQYLHLVDLDGAKSSQIVNHHILEKIANNTNLTIDFGGGLKSEADVKIAFESGASQITGGSVAVQNKALFLQWLEQYGPDKIILGADCLDRKIATHGWLNQSDLDVVEFIHDFRQKGIQTVICTDISKDGMLEGPSFDLYKDILKTCEVQLIASGGIASILDLERLQALGCEAAILGKAIYEGKITLKEISQLC